MEEKIRLQLRFHGRVQGVGFRFTAQHAANAFGITGWVFNDYDGTVLMEAQGYEEQIDKVIQKIEAGAFIEIDQIDKKRLPLVPHESYFSVRD